MTKTRPHEVALPNPQESFLTRLEACRVARIGLSTFDREVARGRLKVTKVGRNVKVERQELERYMRG